MTAHVSVFHLTFRVLPNKHLMKKNREGTVGGGRQRIKSEEKRGGRRGVKREVKGRQ